MKRDKHWFVVRDNYQLMMVELDVELIEAIKEGKLINAIKYYRRDMDCGLREAKEAVEAMVRERKFDT